MARKIANIVTILAAAVGVGVAVWFVLDSFRVKGEISLAPREKVGMAFKVNESLAHGEREETRRWSADYADEVLEVAQGRPAKIRRSWKSCENGASGNPAPVLLQDVVLISAAGMVDEKSGEPWKAFPVTWPDPFYALLPEKPVHHSSEWTVPAAAAAGVAAWLGRGPVTGAHGEAKLEPEMARDGVRCHRIRVALQAKLEDGRELAVWGDLYPAIDSGVLLDMEWLGTLSSEKGEERVTFLRQRRLVR